MELICQQVPPGDDSWDREGDLPPQSFDLWTRINVGENLPFPITPLTETHFPKLFGLDVAAPQQQAPTFQATRRLYGRLYINEGAIVHNFTAMTGLPASLLDRVWAAVLVANSKHVAHFAHSACFVIFRLCFGRE